MSFDFLTDLDEINRLISWYAEFPLKTKKDIDLVDRLKEVRNDIVGMAGIEFLKQNAEIVYGDTDTTIFAYKGDKYYYNWHLKTTSLYQVN